MAQQQDSCILCGKGPLPRNRIFLREEEEPSITVKEIVLADENELLCDLITAMCLQQSDWGAQIGAQGQVLYCSVTRLFRALSLPRATKRQGQTSTICVPYSKKLSWYSNNIVASESLLHIISVADIWCDKIIFLNCKFTKRPRLHNNASLFSIICTVTFSIGFVVFTQQHKQAFSINIHYQLFFYTSMWATHGGLKTAKRKENGSLTTFLATERVEGSGDTAKKFLALCLVFGCLNQNERDTCTCETSLNCHVAINWVNWLKGGYGVEEISYEGWRLSSLL